MDGRKLKLIQDAPRWIDDFTVPGQFIGVRGIQQNAASNGAEKLLAITSSPNEARVDSALLDATILEVTSKNVQDSVLAASSIPLGYCGSIG